MVVREMRRFRWKPGVITPFGCGPPNIRSFPEKGITVIISSHILSEIQQTADYIGIIAKGTVGFEGKLQEQQDLEALFMKVVAKGGNES